MKPRLQSGRVPDSAVPQWLPDFCSLPVVFAVMVVAEFLVLAILIAPSDESRPLLARVATTSVFVQWLALLCVVCLCQLRVPLKRLSPWVSVAVAYTLIVAITIIGSALVFLLDHQLRLGLSLPTQFEARFIWRNALLCALLGAALLRYFYVIEQWRARLRAEAKARFDALQARIRPHFLFNSMNTIASLISERPQEAERAVENLSDLFRAALGAGDALSTLGTELDLIRQYLSIEQWRLGKRLNVHIEVDMLPQDLAIPSLLLQPLVENAVYHGIEPLAEGGTIDIQGELSDGSVVISIRNPRPPVHGRVAGGNGIALVNTRGRIEYHFGTRGALEIDDSATHFQVTVRLPDESTHS